MEDFSKWLSFKALSWAEWKAEYLQYIRADLKVDKIRKIDVGVILVGENTSVYVVKYPKGSWHDSAPQCVKVGPNLYLVRLPAVKVGTKYLILDGVHRLEWLQPRLIILDFIEPRVKDRCYFTDLFGPFWRHR